MRNALRNKKRRRKSIIFLIIAFVTFLVQMFIWNVFLKPSGASQVSVLNEGWDVEYNDIRYTYIKLSDLRGLIGHSTLRGDRIVLSRRVSDLNTYNSPTLMFETRFSAWEVMVNDRVLASKHYNAYANDEFIGCENNFVSIPPYKAPINLKIELFVAEDGAYNFFEPLAVGSYMDILMYGVYNHVFIFLISAFLIIFGLMFFAISVGFKSDLPEIDMQIYSSLLFILLGVWFLAQFKILDIIMDTHGHQTEIEFIALYLMVPVMYLAMGSMQSYLKNKLFLSFFITGSSIPFLLIALHFAGITHINRMLTIFQLDALVLIVFMLIMLIIDTKQGRVTSSQLIQIIGASMLANSFIFNMLFYFLEMLGITEQIRLSKEAVPVGAMCMVFATLVNYQIYIADSFARKKENESLAHLAYADGLTGIPNRSRYEKFLDDLQAGEEDYCIISIDLNGLKKVNDTEGHIMGDRYLSEFTKTLENCFKWKGFIARIGGDEFVAILQGEYLNSADELIKNLNFALSNMNKRDPSINRSAATGYAFRHEAEGNDWNSVYLLADERMYKKKSEMKSEKR